MVNIIECFMMMMSLSITIFPGIGNKKYIDDYEKGIPY